MGASSFICIAVVKCLDKKKNNLREKVCFGYSSKLQLVTAKEPRWQRFETASHITPTAKERREDEYIAYLLACAQLSKFLYTYAVQNPYLGNGATHSGLGLPKPINAQEDPRQKCPQVNLVQIILIKILFPDGPLLCQADSYS